MKLLSKNKTKNQTFSKLTTPFENSLSSEAPFGDYPRPQLKRDSYICLNGKWSFELNGKVIGNITVPFPPESRISGIGRDVGDNDVFSYSRAFTIDETFIKDRVLLHFGAVDLFCTVYINNVKVGSHSGGYLPFSFDITDYVKIGQNTVYVEVTDPLNSTYPYGKQRKKRGGMWYTKTSGIWQTVWLESVPKKYVKGIRITPTLDSVVIEVDGGEDEKTIFFEDKEYSFIENTFTLCVDNPVNWTPETPHLYHFTLKTGDDSVRSYFALRTVSTGKINNKPYILLNDKPYYFHGILDQGYFSDGIFMPASAKGFKNDILKMKECGFNMLRKHIKLEPDLFYYYCDKYGMAVFQDFINSGGYNFIIDTALPTLFLRRGVTHRVSKKRRAAFFETCEGVVNTLYNHPSVVYYTIFNEGWGQFEADKCYAHFKNFDTTRIYDTTSGWFKEKLTDVESDHIYFRTVKHRQKISKPWVLSEFGGYCCKIKNHVYNPLASTGYSFFTEDREQFENALIDMYNRDVIANIKHGLCASVLTQLSDVEDETNGLMTYDRQILKVNTKTMLELSESIFKEFYQNIK